MRDVDNKIESGIGSYTSGTADQPLIYQTIGDCLKAQAETRPNHPALVVCHQSICWTYQELYEQSEKLAKGLLALGLQPGDRLGIWAPNRVEWVMTQFATSLCGVILVNINPSYRTHELSYVLQKVGCKALITAQTFKKSNYIDMLLEVVPELNVCPPGTLASQNLPHLEWVIHLSPETGIKASELKLSENKNQLPQGFLSFEELLEKGKSVSQSELAEVQSKLSPDDAINIQFTSGTTGFPKGATLSHFNILNNGFYVAEGMHFTEKDKLCIPVPLYHCFGMVMANLGCVTHGATMVFPSEGYDPEAALRAVETEQCTGLYGVPTMFIAERELTNFEQFDLTSLRTGVMAGAPCPIELMKQVIHDMHISEMTICYGMTETSPVSFQTTPDDSLERRVSTVGKIHPHLQAKVVKEDGSLAAVGETGELWVRGYSVMKGYWDEPEKTVDVLDENGWMHSGDLATLDQDGYCNIVGRVKDMVIRGGENIYPREVEEFLHQHPAIQNVQCFGIPNPKYGEVLCAWIHLKDEASVTEQEIKQYCEGKIAHFKIPTHVKFVTEYPMTITGKIQKFKMRELMAESLGAKEIVTA
jgi:fatty-acyl-CoA synthase